MTENYPDEMVAIAALFLSSKPEDALMRFWQLRDGRLSRALRQATPDTLHVIQGALSENDKIKDVVEQIQQARETPGK